MAIYTCRGSVRGACGIRHRSLGAAAACARRDQRGCASLGGGAYSDRRVVALDTDGEPRDLTEAEVDEIFQLAEA